MESNGKNGQEGIAVWDTTQNRCRLFFFISIPLMLLILWMTGYGSGFGSDELDMNAYGKANIAYYVSGGKDTTFMHPSLGDGTVMPAATLPYYGSAFEYMAYGLNKIAGNQDGYEIDTRHMLNQFLAVLALLLTGMLARFFTGHYFSALVAAWAMFLTPVFFGLSIWNTKDIPFLFGYIATLYFMVRFLHGLPRPDWKMSLGLMCSLAFALSIRIGGILLIAFMFLYLVLLFLKGKEQRKVLIQHIPDWGRKLVLVLGGAFLITILAWPFVLRDPLHNLPAAINIARNFPQKIPLAFEGEYIDSLQLPWYFLPKHMGITIPVLLVLLFPASLYLAWKPVSKPKRWLLAMLLFSSLFPLGYAIYQKMPVYNSWRHLLFIYPDIIVFCAAGLQHVLLPFRKTIGQWSMLAATFLLLVGPVSWLLRSKQYQYIYYNEFAGGLKEAYYNYETDYWEISLKEGLDWLVKNEQLLHQKDTVKIGTNGFSIVYYCLKHKYPGSRIKVVQTSVKRPYQTDWHYALLNNFFLPPEFLEHNFPVPHTVHTISVDDMPLTLVVKDTNRYDYKAVKQFTTGNFRMADSLFTTWFTSIGINPATSGKNFYDLDGMAAFCKLAVNDNVTALAFAENALRNDPGSYLGYLVKGAVLMNSGQAAAAELLLRTAQQLNRQDIYAKYFLAHISVNKR